MEANLIEAKAAAEQLLAADQASRQAEAARIQALCDLAENYRLDQDELIEILADRRIRIGGDGTPLVSEMVCLEIAGLLRCTPRAAGGRLADALNLKHRHPRLFEATQQGDIEAARALKAAARCHDLHPMLADQITGRWLKFQDRLGWTAAFNLLDKLIIEADPELAAEKERKAREQRGVWLWGLDQGVMNLTGKLDVLDAGALDLRLNEIAQLLEDQFPDLTHEQRRSKALRALSDPYTALALLEGAPQPELFTQATTADISALAAMLHRIQEAHDQQAPFDREAEPPIQEPDQPPGPHEPADPREPLADRQRQGWPEPGFQGPTDDRDAPEPAPAPPDATRNSGSSCEPLPSPPGSPHACACSCPTCREGSARTRNRRARRQQKLSLVVHIHSDAIGDLTGAARVERAGHITTRLLAELLGEDLDAFKLKVQPIIDLTSVEPEDRYQPSRRMRQTIEILFEREAFPFSNRASRGLDLDHTTAYRAGLPGQTRVGNLAPLSRKVHRAKTAGFWTLDQPSPGQMVWTSPLGYQYDVTEHGARRRTTAP